MATKKFVSIEKLGLYDEKIKALIDSKDADTLSASKEYSNSLADNYDTAGTAATKANEALDSAKAYTDGKVGTVPEGSTVMGIIKNIQDNAYDDTAINNKIDGVSEKVTTLIGDDASKSVRTIANEELTKQLIPENADQSLDTLQEIAQWIQDHPGDAATMNSAISALQTKVDTGDKNVSTYVADAIAALKIGDYAKAADLTNHIADAVAHINATERTKWNAALQKDGIATGTANGTISVGGDDVAVKGLGSAAYTDSTAYDAAGTAAAVETALGARIDEFVECSEDDITALFATA